MSPGELVAVLGLAGTLGALVFRAGGILRELRELAGQVAELRLEVKQIGEGYRALRVEHELRVATETCTPIHHVRP